MDVRRRSSWQWLGALAAGNGFGHDADVGDSGLAESVNDGGEAAEGHGLVAAEEDGILRPFELFVDASTEVVNVDGFVAEVYALSFVDGDDEPLLGDFADGFGLGDVNFDAGLKDGSGDHEDDEQDEDDVDKRDHVDFGERGLRGFGELRHGLEIRDSKMENQNS